MADPSAYVDLQESMNPTREWDTSENDSMDDVPTDHIEVPSDFSSNRKDLNLLLESWKWQYTVIGLVLLDCIVVLVELFLDLHKKQECGDEEHEEDHHKSGTEKALHALHVLSLTILSIFIVELLLKLYARGLTFFHHKGEVFDGVVVLVSFILDIVFIGEENALSLLILLRLWRLTRIVHGLIHTVQHKAAKKLEKEQETRKLLEGEVEMLRQKVKSLEGQC